MLKLLSKESMASTVQFGKEDIRPTGNWKFPALQAPPSSYNAAVEGQHCFNGQHLGIQKFLIKSPAELSEFSISGPLPRNYMWWLR